MTDIKLKLPLHTLKYGLVKKLTKFGTYPAGTYDCLEGYLAGCGRRLVDRFLLGVVRLADMLLPWLELLLRLPGLVSSLESPSGGNLPTSLCSVKFPLLLMFSAGSDSNICLEPFLGCDVLG